MGQGRPGLEKNPDGQDQHRPKQAHDTPAGPSDRRIGIAHLRHGLAGLTVDKDQKGLADGGWIKVL